MDRMQGARTEGPSELPESCLGATREPVLGPEDVSRESPSDHHHGIRKNKQTSLEWVGVGWNTDTAAKCSLSKLSARCIVDGPKFQHADME